jgi:hypothetical protein
VQTQLSLIEQAAKLCRIDRDSLWIATVGGTLMKAGKSVKTLNHRLAATAFSMTASYLTVAELMSKHDYGETEIPSVDNTLHGK